MFEQKCRFTSQKANTFLIDIGEPRRAMGFMPDMYRHVLDLDAPDAGIDQQIGVEALKRCVIGLSQQTDTHTKKEATRFGQWVVDIGVGEALEFLSRAGNGIMPERIVDVAP